MNIENIILAHYLKQVLEYKTMIFMLHVVTQIRDPSNKFSEKGGCVENERKLSISMQIHFQIADT